MEKDYFQSAEFKELLASYEKEKAKGQSIYLDADDFADIADYYIGVDSCDLAMEAVEMGLSIHPDEEVLHVVKSAAYIYQHEYDEAERILQGLDPKSPDVKYQNAQLLYAKYDDTEGAEAAWRDWMEEENGENPSERQKRDVYIHVISSLVELRLDEWEEKDFDEEVVGRWVREYIQKFQPLGRYDEDVQLADICRENDLPELMCEVLAQVLEERPYLPKGWSNLALAQYLSMQYEQALESCGFALAIDADDLDALLTKAHTYHALKEKGQAKLAFKEYLDKGGNEPQIIPYAELLFNDGEDAEAQTQLQKLYDFITERKQMAEAHLHDIQTNRTGDKVAMETAQHFYDDVMDSYERILTDMGELYHQNGYHADSIAVNKLLIEVSEQNAEAHFMLGINQLALSRYKEATQSFANALRWADDQVMMGVDIALTFVLNNYDQFALQVLNAVSKVAEDSDSPFVKNIPAVKSITYLKLGSVDQFMEQFEVACRQTPNLVRQVYDGCFPEGLPVEEWYDYAKENLDKILKKMQKEDSHVE